MLTDLLRLAVPVACPGCGAQDVALCPGCAAGFQAPARRVSPPAWSAATGSWDVPVTAVARYEGAARDVLVGWKDGGRLELRSILALALAKSVRCCLSSALGDPQQQARPPGATLWLVPVPSSRAAVRRRGEDVMVQLARAAAGSLRANTVEGAPSRGPGPTIVGGRPDPWSIWHDDGASVRVSRRLVQGAGVRDQAGLDAAQRVANTRGRLRIRRSSPLVHWLGMVPAGTRPTPGAWVVLVDDIVTTGASLAAAAAVLRAEGLTVAGAATVAWTPRRWGGPSDPHSPALRTVEAVDAGLAWRPRPDERGEAPRA